MLHNLSCTYHSGTINILDGLSTTMDTLKGVIRLFDLCLSVSFMCLMDCNRKSLKTLLLVNEAAQGY